MRTLGGPVKRRVLEYKDFRFLTSLRYVRNDRVWLRCVRNDRVWLRCVRNDHGLAKATYGDKNGLVPGTGNHKGCPYDGFIGAYFHSNDHGLVEAI